MVPCAELSSSTEYCNWNNRDKLEAFPYEPRWSQRNVGIVIGTQFHYDTSPLSSFFLGPRVSLPGPASTLQPDSFPSCIVLNKQRRVGNIDKLWEAPFQKEMPPQPRHFPTAKRTRTRGGVGGTPGLEPVRAERASHPPRIRLLRPQLLLLWDCKWRSPRIGRDRKLCESGRKRWRSLRGVEWHTCPFGRLVSFCY